MADPLASRPVRTVPVPVPPPAAPPERQVLAQLGNMLPIAVVGPLLRAIGTAAERIGYTDVSTDQAWRVVGTPPTNGFRIDDDE